MSEPAPLPADHPYADQCERMYGMCDNEVMMLWKHYDGTNAPLGISGEAIHFELNRRGLGKHCAV